MNSDPTMADAIPAALDDDDDDVAWALQTAAVQWKRGLFADAIVWLRRAVDAAIQTGNPQRATDLNHAAADLTERMLASAAAAAPAPGSDSGADIDALLDRPPLQQPGRASIDIEFEDAPPVGAHPPPPGRPPPPRPVSNPFLTPEPVTGGAFPSVPHVDDSPTIAEEAIEEVEPEPLEDSAPLPRFPSASGDEEVRYTEQELPPFPTSAEFEQPTHPGWSPTSQETETSPPPRAHPEHEEEPRVRPPTYDEPFPEDLGRLTEPAAPLGRGSMPDMIAEAGLLTSEPPTAVEAPPEPEPAPEPEPEEARIGEVSLADVRGLEDLPPEAQLEFAACARLERLGSEEEVGSFAVGLVIEGDVALMPTIADVPIARARRGDVVFTQGTLQEGIALRVVAGDSGALVATWDQAAWQQATADCPWVADELREVADRFQALAGAAMGELGERFDESLRAAVTDRCEVRALLSEEVLVEAGCTVPGMYIVGGGRIELLNGEGGVDTLGPGEFLFPAQVLAAGKASRSARAGADGALVLFADRMTAHELLVSVPPLIEILAS